MTMDFMYEAVQGLAREPNPGRLRALARKLGPDACAALDELVRRELDAEAMEYLRIEGDNRSSEAALMKLIRTDPVNDYRLKPVELGSD